MQGAGAGNRFGFQRADEDSVSGFQFAGAWAELNADPAGNLADVERHRTESKMLSKIQVPPRPSTPVGGFSTNDSSLWSPSSRKKLDPKSKHENAGKTDNLNPPGSNSTYTSENNEISGLDNVQNKTIHTKLRDNDRFSISTSTNSTSSIHKPLISGKLSRSISHNNLGALVAKFSACACDRLNLHQTHHSASSGDSSQSFGCLSTSSCVALGIQGERPTYSLTSIDQTAKLWVNKHRPESLSSFVTNCRQAQELKHLISGGHCHHLLFQGPPGCGKKTLIMALLRDTFGVSAWMVREFTRTFDIEGTQVPLPMTSSAHHVEVNLVHVGVYLRPVLTTLLKEMKVACTADDNDSFVRSYKVLVLHDADKVSADAQQQIRWLMDRYSDYCKFMLLCLDQSKICDSIRSRCIVVDVPIPTVEEVVQVLYFVARRENLDLPDKFAWRIAKASKTLRQAVLSLEACKLNHYPFDENQLIVTEWENDIVSMARDIIDQQNPRRLYRVRGKIQTLLDQGVAAKLILWRLVDEFVKLVEAPLRDEINQWAKFYAKRLPDGMDALFKLEEFVAKLMSLYKKCNKA